MDSKSPARYQWPSFLISVDYEHNYVVGNKNRFGREYAVLAINDVGSRLSFIRSVAQRAELRPASPSLALSRLVVETLGDICEVIDVMNLSAS
jgi:hypothetical protein